MPRAVRSEMFETSRVPSGHGFLATIKNPQPDGMRLATLSSAAASGLFSSTFAKSFGVRQLIAAFLSGLVRSF